MYLGDYSSIADLVLKEGMLSDTQIDLLKRAVPHNLNYYSVSLEDGTKFITYYTEDILNITENKLRKWNNG